MEPQKELELLRAIAKAARLVIKEGNWVSDMCFYTYASEIDSLENLLNELESGVMRKAYFVGVDDFCRPTFEEILVREHGTFKMYYCLTDLLFPLEPMSDEELQARIDEHDVVYKGNNRDAEPNYATKGVRLLMKKES